MICRSPYYLNATDVAHVAGFMPEKYRLSHKRIVYKTMFGIDTDDDTRLLRDLTDKGLIADPARNSQSDSVESDSVESDSVESDSVESDPESSHPESSRPESSRPESDPAARNLESNSESESDPPKISENTYNTIVSSIGFDKLPATTNYVCEIQAPLEMICHDAIMTKSHLDSIRAREGVKKKIDKMKIQNVDEVCRIKDICDNIVNKQRGKILEENVITAYEKKCQTNLEHKNDKTKYCRISGVSIGGRVDAYDTGNQEVIEIKNRMYKFLGVRPYDKCQLEIYMKLFGAKKARLIEKFDNETREHTYDHDPAFFVEIENGIANYRESVKSVLSTLDTILPTDSYMIYT